MAASRAGLLFLALAFVPSASPAVEDEGEALCPAGAADSSCAGNDGTLPPGEKYWWPHARGHVGRYGATTLPGPINLTASVAWTWQHPAKAILPGATLIDGARNLYLPAMDGVRKFSPDGHLLWHFWEPTMGTTQANPSLMDGMLFHSTLMGFVYALNIESGQERWRSQPATECEMDSPYVEAHDGVVMAIFDRRSTKTSTVPGNTRVVAMNATDGHQLWEYTSDKVLWNFAPMFIGDGTFITMDIHGGIYRMRMHTGERVWHAPPPSAFETSFTDGGVILGPGNGVAYSCSNKGNGFPDTLGALRAYRVSDGKLLWDQELPEACVSWPAVSSDNRTVVVPVGALPFPLPAAPVVVMILCAWPVVLLLRAITWLGSRRTKKCRKARRCTAWFNCCWAFLAVVGIPCLVHGLSILLDQRQSLIWQNPPKPLEVLAFDAQAGTPQWRYRDIPSWGKVASAGDEEHFWYRIFKGQYVRPVCGPASWSAPTVDGRGTTYAAAMNGYMYAIRDADGNGAIDSETEVSIMRLGAASLHGGSAFAPGMMAFASCDELFVFRT